MRSEAVTEALLQRDFARAERLAAEWGQAVKDLAAASLTSADRRRIVEAAQQQAEQNLYLAQVMRAHIASELHANSASFLYSTTDLYANADLERPRWRLRG